MSELVELTNGALPVPASKEVHHSASVCHKVFDSLCVLSSGDIVCWCADVNAQRVYGNVYTDRIADVFNSAKYEEMRDWLLKSPPGIWCPAINNNCSFRNVPATSLNLPERRIKHLQIEATSYCNLKCPACFVETTFKEDPRLKEIRGRKMLPYETMLDIVEQLPDLEFIHYYNYGEPFINKDTIRFLSEVKRNKPTAHVSVSTNGTVLSPSQISAIAEGALVNQMIFSIDGATQESYQRYRVGGSFHKAFSKMVELTRACRDAGTWTKYSALDPSKVAITWQYILFEWNDSDEELEAARQMAREIDIPMLWVITSGYGASQRFLPGSDLVANLSSPPNFTTNQAAQSQVETYLENNMLETIPISGILKKIPFDESIRVAESGVRGSSFSMVRQIFSKWLMGRPKLNRIAYDASISCGQSVILASPNETIIFDLEVANHSDISWDNESLGRRIRLGLALQDERGALSEIGGTEIPTESTNAAGVGTTRFLITLPNVGGDYSLIVDFVHEHVCWFSHRGSNPLVIKIKIENSSTQV